MHCFQSGKLTGPRFEAKSILQLTTAYWARLLMRHRRETYHELQPSLDKGALDLQASNIDADI